MASLHTAQIAIRARGDKKCPYHEGKDVVFVCEDCDGELTCTTCVSTIHKKHAVEEISDVISRVKVNLQDFVNKMESVYIPELKEKMNTLESEISKNNNHFKEVIANIQNQRDNLKQELDKVTNTYTTLCQEIEEKNNNILKNYKIDLQSKTEEMSSRLVELKDTLQVGSNTQVYDISREIPNDINIPTLPLLPDAEYNPTSILINQFQECVKNLSVKTRVSETEVNSLLSPIKQNVNVTCDNKPVQDITVVDKEAVTTPQKGRNEQLTRTNRRSKKTSNQNFETFTLFKTFDLHEEAHIIHATSENEFYMKDWNGVLSLVNYEEKTTKMMTMEVDVTNFYVAPSTGVIWFCSDKDNSVRKVTGDKTSTVMFQTDKKPTAICISSDGYVLLGTERQIVKYDFNGHILCSTGTESKWLVKKVPVVRQPLSISQCPVTKNIAVLEFDGEEFGGDHISHVSILHEDLRLLRRYYGHDIKPFCPWDVCYSSTGDIYVADCMNASIQRISGKGNFIQTVYKDHKKPASLVSVNSKGDILAVFALQSLKVFQKQNS